MGSFPNSYLIVNSFQMFSLTVSAWMGVWWFHSTTTHRRLSRGKYCRLDRKRWKWW
jgi:hypothetical protein